MTSPKAKSFSNTEKDPDDWVSGDEPMTRCASVLFADPRRTAHQSFEYHEDLTKAEASKLIDELRRKAGIAGE